MQPARPMPSLLSSSLAFACSLVLVHPAAAQAPTPAPQEPKPAAAAPAAVPGAPHHLVRRYPQDKDVAIAVVGSRTLTLGELVDHITARHFPPFRQLLENPERTEYQRMLASDLMAPWVRHFADLEALQQTFGEELKDKAKVEAAQSAALKTTFQRFLDTYAEDRKKRGIDAPLTQERVNQLLADFQHRSGLAAELQGVLDLLEPGEYPRGVLQQFFNDNARAFGGQVTMSHILIQHRDAGTGLLLDQEGLARANTRLADIKARLKPDGSNFEEIARLYSDDTRTGQDGGRLVGVHRYDERLPATLCRALWNLRDGEISTEPVETQYGWHLLKRVEFTQQVFILFTDDAIPTIKHVMMRARQEDRLMKAREQTRLRLLL